MLGKRVVHEQQRRTVSSATAPATALATAPSAGLRPCLRPGGVAIGAGRELEPARVAHDGRLGA
eukprot:scaffold127021_cov63-Phaeocystis_antarctica.AAC.2